MEDKALTYAERVKQHKDARLYGALCLIGLGIAAGYVAGDFLPFIKGGSQPTTSLLAVGDVKCADGQAVEGVWVEAGASSGWANFYPEVSAVNAKPLSVVYDFFRGISQSTYTVHVGCGGSPEKWTSADYSSPAPANLSVGFVCLSGEARGTPGNRGVCGQEPLVFPTVSRS